jgi:acyl carrier protein
MTELNAADSARLVKLIDEHLGGDIEKITDEASFVDDLGADSLDVVELVMAFEELFGVEISDADAETIYTVHDAKMLIARLRSEK